MRHTEFATLGFASPFLLKIASRIIETLSRIRVAPRDRPGGGRYDWVSTSAPSRSSTSTRTRPPENVGRPARGEGHQHGVVLDDLLRHEKSEHGLRDVNRVASTAIGGAGCLSGPRCAPGLSFTARPRNQRAPRMTKEPSGTLALRLPPPLAGATPSRTGPWMSAFSLIPCGM